MNDPFEKVDAGDALNITARTWNAVLDSARGFARAELGRPDPPQIGALPPASVQVHVKNTTGATLPQFSVVKVSGTPLISAVTAPNQVNKNPVLPGAAPTGPTSAFAITIEPIVPNGIGQAIGVGYAVCDLVVNSAAHEYAAPGTSTSALQSRASGPARILWKNGSSGTVRAVVLLTGASESATDGDPDDGLTDGKCKGGAWAIALRSTDRWKLQMLGGPGPIVIEPPDSDDTEITINGVVYIVDWVYGAPSLTFTPKLGSGVPITATLDCLACPCFRFGVERIKFYPDEDIAAGVCERLVYFTVCQYCPGGWYCAREAGTSDLFEPLELLEGEPCSGVWEIRSGPYEDETAARRDCGSTPGCSPDPRGIVNVFTMDLRGLVTLVPGQCAPGAMCDQWNRVWELSQPFPGDCFWQNRPQFPLPDCSNTLGGNFFSRIHRGESPFFGLGYYNRLFINYGAATWTYYGSVPGWDGRAPYTFYLASGPGVAGAPELYCNMPSAITVYPV